MELFIDSADIAKIRELDSVLTVSGVTTNPSILAKAGKSPREVVSQLDEVLGPEKLIFVQTIRTDFQGIVSDAQRIVSLREKNILVKIPVTPDGLKAIKYCASNGIRTLATAVYSADQAFLAAMNGAEYLAPYVNRMNNYCDGIAQVRDLLQMLSCAGLPAKVVAASFKSVFQVHELVKAGIQAVTISPDIAYSMICHTGTQAAVDDFSKIWKDSGIEL